MNNEPVATIPFCVFEAAETRSNRRTGKLMVAVLVLIGVLLATNTAWLCAFLWRL